MADKKTRWSTNEKIRIVLQTFNPETRVAELCHEHNLSPRTLYTWKEKFLEGGKDAVARSCTGRILRKHTREVETLKKIIWEYAVANEALKNVGGRQRMMAAREASKGISLTKSLSYCGVSRTAWHYTKKPRIVAIDDAMKSEIMEIARARPTYGTRGMAAQVSRQSGIPVNRKKVARIYRKLGWTAPKMRKSEIIRSNRKVPRPTQPGQFWEADVSYIWCGRDG